MLVHVFSPTVLFVSSRLCVSPIVVVCAHPMPVYISPQRHHVVLGQTDLQYPFNGSDLCTRLGRDWDLCDRIAYLRYSRTRLGVADAVSVVCRRDRAARHRDDRPIYRPHLHRGQASPPLPYQRRVRLIRPLGPVRRGSTGLIIFESRWGARRAPHLFMILTILLYFFTTVAVQGMLRILRVMSYVPVSAHVKLEPLNGLRLSKLPPRLAVQSLLARNFHSSPSFMS